MEHDLNIQVGGHYGHDPARFFTEHAVTGIVLIGGGTSPKSRGSERTVCLGEHEIELAPTVEIVNGGMFCR